MHPTSATVAGLLLIQAARFKFAFVQILSSVGTEPIQNKSGDVKNQEPENLL